MRFLHAARGLALLSLLTLAHCASDSNDAANGAAKGGTTGSGGSSGGSQSGGSPAKAGSAGAATGGAASSVGGAAAPTGGKAGSGGAAAAGGTSSGGTSAGGAAAGGASGVSGSSGSSAKAGAGGGGASAGGSGGSSATGGAASGGVAGSQSGSGGLAGGGAGGGKSFSPCAAAMPCAVLPLGDSITEGYASSGGGYRVELFRQAVKNGKNLTFVGTLQNGPNNNDIEGKMFPRRHEGHGGFTIENGSGHNGIAGQVTTQGLAQKPSIVLLMIGTNDINGNVDVAQAPTRLGKLIDDITTAAPDVLVVVATIIPVVDNGTDQRIKTYNSAIPGLVSSRAAAGKHVQFLDIYDAFSKEPNSETALMADNLHPNDAGYVVLGRTFYNAIASVLPNAP